MIDQPFRIVGRVLNLVTGRGVPGLRVEAWDRDARIHDHLGVASTDVEGGFVISFDERAFFDANSNDTLPDVFFKIYYGRNLIKTTQDEPIMNMPRGEYRVELKIELFLALMDGSGGPVQSSDDRDPSTAQSGPSVEVALHELGQSIAVTVASVQRELSRYPNTIGTYVLDEIEMTIPVQVRVDTLGQVLTTVAQGDITNQAVGNVHMKFRPVPGLITPPPIIADQPLDTLGLPDDAITRLKLMRIFSVEDLLRVSSTSVGRQSLERQLAAYTDTAKVLSIASLLTMPNVPLTVGEALIRMGFTDPTDFARADPATVAKELAGQLNQPISEDDVWYWQNQVEQASQLSLPSKSSDFHRPRPDEQA